MIQLASVHGGRPVSSVEFERLTVDMRPVRHLVAEAFRELHATADRNLERFPCPPALPRALHRVTAVGGGEQAVGAAESGTTHGLRRALPQRAGKEGGR